MNYRDKLIEQYYLSIKEVVTDIVQKLTKIKEEINRIDEKSIFLRVIDDIYNYYTFILNLGERKVVYTELIDCAKSIESLSISLLSELSESNYDIAINGLKKCVDELSVTLKSTEFNHEIDAERTAANRESELINVAKERLNYLNQVDEKARLIGKRLEELQKRSEGLNNKIAHSHDRLEENLADQKRLFENGFGKIVKRYDDLYNSSLHEVQEKLTAIEQIEIKTKRLAELASSNALHSGYEKNANSEKEMADYLRYACLGLMFSVVFVLGFTLYQLNEKDINWYDALVRLGISFMASIPVGYLAKESNRHRVYAVEFKKTALDMEALEPFLGNMDAVDVQKLKAEFAQRVFFSQSKILTESTYDLNAQELLVQALDVVKEFAKNKKDK